MSNVHYLPSMYKALLLNVAAEKIHLDDPVAAILPSPYPNSKRFDQGSTRNTS